MAKAAASTMTPAAFLLLTALRVLLLLAAVAGVLLLAARVLQVEAWASNKLLLACCLW